MDDGLEFRAVQVLQYQDTSYNLISFTLSTQLERSYLQTYHLPYTHTIPYTYVRTLSLSYSLTRPSEREVEITAMTHFLLQEQRLNKQEVKSCSFKPLHASPSHSLPSTGLSPFHLQPQAALSQILASPHRALHS